MTKANYGHSCLFVLSCSTWILSTVTLGSMNIHGITSATDNSVLCRKTTFIPISYTAWKEAMTDSGTQIETFWVQDTPTPPTKKQKNYWKTFKLN